MDHVTLPPPSSRNALVLPESHQALVRSLVALPELPMRVLWLSEKMTAESAHLWAPLLERLAEQAQTTDPLAREAILTLAIVLAIRHESAWLWSLREAARTHAYLNLDRLVREPPRESDSSQLGLVELDRAVPDYGSGRELTVGERRSLARRPTREQLARLLLDPHPLVLEQLFQSTALTEADVVKVATRRPATLAAMTFIATSPKWMTRRRVKMSVILNPGSPHGLALPYVSTCPREDLQLIIEATTISSTLRGVARELHSRLPPVSDLSTHRGPH